MKHLIKILFVLALFFSTQLCAKKFTVGIDNWKPFVYFENNEPKGLTVDMFKKLAKELNYDIEFKYIPWSRILKMMESGKIDAVGNLSFSEKRAKFIEYTKPPFYSLKTRFYALENSDVVIKKHEDLRKYLFLVGQDYVYYPEFDNDSNIKKDSIHDRIYNGVSTDASETMINMLIKKRVKILISANAIMDHSIKKLSLEKTVKKIEYMPLANDFQYIGISKKSPFIKDIDKINEAMKRILNKSQ